jgi:conjugal transfer pilus assembly protein TraI
MRLSPPVRDALVDIVSTLNGDAKRAAACTVSAGVFVPISELTARKVDADFRNGSQGQGGIGVGIQKGRIRTVEHDFGGRCELGFILSPLMVEGLNPADFSPAP